MESLYFLIPLSIVVVTLGLGLFFWAVNNGQYDDLDGEAERILFEDLDTSGQPSAEQIDLAQSVSSNEAELAADISTQSPSKGAAQHQVEEVESS